MNKNLKEVQGYSFKFVIELDQAMTHLKKGKLIDSSSLDKQERHESLNGGVSGNNETLKDGSSSSSNSGLLMNGDEGKIGEEGEGEGDLLSAVEIVMDEIGGALWRGAYARRDEVDVDHVMPLAE